MTTSKTFGIGFPTINRWDLLQPSLEKYLASFPDTQIFVLDNGKQDIKIKAPNFHVLVPVKPQSVAASWNALCNFIFLYNNFALILNDDIFFDKRQHEVQEFLTINYASDFYVSEKGYCSFIMPKRTFKKVGKFDESFKGAYFEDNDYSRRLRLDNAEVLKTSFLTPAIYNESMSTIKDSSLKSSYDANLVHYMDKWGGGVGAETFNSPFNK